MDVGTLNFDLTIEPDPRLVSAVRRFVESAFGRVDPNPDAIFRVSMTAHELMENAAKYSSGSQAALGVSVKREPHAVQVTLRLVNEAAPAHVERLRQKIEAINNSPDPAGLYRQMMLDSLKLEGESGLGLARIFAEGEMKLTLEVRGETVTIVASTRIAEEGDSK